MSNEVAQKQSVDIETVQRVILGGDLSSLNPTQKVQYYKQVCDTLGLNSLTKPFDYIRLNGKEVLYANKGCTEQLRMNRKISIKVTAREKIEDIYVVTAEASGADGRVDSSTGAVSISGLRGEALANAMMKAETKSKRRVTLSICGLNMLDETEVETLSKQNTIVPDREGAAQNGNTDPTVYKITFGKFNGRSLEEIYNDPRLGPDAIINYISFLETSEKKTGKPLSATAIEFIKQADSFLGAMENREIAANDALNSAGSFEDYQVGE